MKEQKSPQASQTTFQNLMDEDSIRTFQKFFTSSKDLMSCYRCAIMEIETKFRVLNERFSLTHDRNPIDNIQTRLKSPESIHEKLIRKNLPLTLEAVEENLFDIAGVRVVCSFVDDIYMLADCLLRQDDITLIRRKDYIKNPKEKKLMRVEVQLRTIAMEFWANLEHQLRYKKDLSPKIIARTTRQLNECAQLSSILDSQMQDIRDMIENDSMS